MTESQEGLADRLLDEVIAKAKDKPKKSHAYNRKCISGTWYFLLPIPVGIVVLCRRPTMRGKKFCERHSK